VRKKASERQWKRRSTPAACGGAPGSGGGGVARVKERGCSVREEQGSGAPFIGWRRKGRGAQGGGAGSVAAGAING
jgi:hypothetical protein